MTRENYKWLLIGMAIMLFINAIWPSKLESSSDTHIRYFCASGRVFIEFQEKYNTWGTLWLDGRGQPIPCDGKSNIQENVSSRTDT